MGTYTIKLRIFIFLIFGYYVQLYIPRVPSWSWSYGSWIYHYLCNQCLSPLQLWDWTLFIVALNTISINLNIYIPKSTLNKYWNQIPGIQISKNSYLILLVITLVPSLVKYVKGLLGHTWIETWSLLCIWIM